MNARFTAFATALALGAAIPSAASAAQIQVDKPCYRESTPTETLDTVAVSGSGFEPNQPFQVMLNGEALPKGNGTTDAAGGFAGSFPSPQLSSDAVKPYTLTVTQGANSATTNFSVTPFFADFNPGSGNPKKLRVRFKLFGFALLDAHPLVYLHYVRPNGKLKRTIKIGRAQGVCGTIKRTARKKLFPFNAERGHWKLQFDTHKRYHKGQPQVDFLYYTVGVTIRRLFG